MKKMSIYAAAAAALLSTTAMAQQATTPATPATPAPTAQMAPSSTTNAAFVSTQAANQFMASDLIGMTVYGSADENLGEINDLLVDPSGNVVAAVIGVGGFLGIGEKDVAVPFQAVEVSRNSDGKQKMVLRKSKDELKAAPTFAEYESAPATTGSVNRPVGTPATTTPPATNR
ncbi:PRC-barrel domain-containing protein [Xanthobacter sp. KR7-65]|uniref:PRC-barrel domain-containing protein n=1 Tax=Xanthobacter sp. KR7-65 TaxID=3156612 RepID=UPI0032B4A498